MDKTQVKFSGTADGPALWKLYYPFVLKMGLNFLLKYKTAVLFKAYLSPWEIYTSMVVFYFFSYIYVQQSKKKNAGT